MSAAKGRRGIGKMLTNAKKDGQDVQENRKLILRMVGV